MSVCEVKKGGGECIRSRAGFSHNESILLLEEWGGGGGGARQVEDRDEEIGKGK